MCGISGIVNFNEKPVGKDQINLMNNAQIHRGPDGSGIWCDKNIGFGHRRLSIIDLSDQASQPMKSNDNRYIIIYNGEIYNFKELKRELVKKGYAFAYRKYSKKFISDEEFAKANKLGMWSMKFQYPWEYRKSTN